MGAMGSAGAMGSDGQLRIYGDGSENDLMVSASGSLDALVADGNWQFHDVTIAANETLAITSGTIVRCTGTFTNNGAIVVGNGAVGGVAPLPGIAPSAPTAGTTGTGDVHGGMPGLAAAPLAIVRPGLYGGGAGYNQAGSGGNGGGSLVVLALGGIANVGTIHADGQTAAVAGGGGAGGIIVLASPGTISNTGTISVAGQNGADGAVSGDGTVAYGAGGGGGGGIIRYISPTVTDTGMDTVTAGAGGNALATTVTAASRIGGAGGGGGGGAGGGGGGIVANSAQAAGGGNAGVVVTTMADPTALF